MTWKIFTNRSSVTPQKNQKTHQQITLIQFNSVKNTNLILRQKVEGIGGASGKISVMWGSRKRASKSCLNLVFQSGSLKSMAVQEELLLRVLSSAKTPTLLVTLT